MIKAEDFTEREFIPESLWSEYGVKAMRWINPKIPVIMQFLRDYYNSPIRINDYFYGGHLDGRCLRFPNDNSYKPLSCHSFGNACDFDVKGKTAEEVRTDITTKCYNTLTTLGVTGIEADVTWVHITVSDLSNWTELKDINGIKIIPKP